MPPAVSRARADVRSLRLSVVDGALHAVMLGVTESYLGALAVELGHRDLALALMVTVPLFAGALAQLASGPLARLLGGRRRLVVGAALGQALAHVAFLAIALSGDGRLWTLLTAKVLYWMTGMVLVPPWNTWMVDLTEAVDRERYFARRSSLVHGVLLVAFVGGGEVLAAGGRRHGTLEAFAVLYGIGLVARLGSALALGAQRDPTPPPPQAEPFGARLRVALREGHLRVPVYVGALMFGAQIAVPFFTPYMLRTLGFGFRQFAAVVAVSVLTKALTFPLWRRAGVRWGLRSVLLASGASISAVPLLWASTESFELLLIFNALSGIAWAGFEFSSLQLLIQDAPPTASVEYFSLANSLSGVMQIAGSLFGSAMLEVTQLSYPQVFMVSAVGRAAALAVLLPAIWRLVPLGHLRRFFVRLVSVRPTLGIVRTAVPAPAEPDEAEPPLGELGLREPPGPP